MIRSILDFLSTAWNFEFSLAPVLATYLFFDLPAIIRRITRKAYLPIYFMFFPLAYADKMYAEYFNEDDHYGVGKRLSQKQKAALRKKIQRTAVFSMIFATVVAPWLCGIVSVLYLTNSQFVQFVWFLMIVKTLLLAGSLMKVRTKASFVVKSNSFKYVVLIYIAYLAFIYYGLVQSHGWAASHLQNGFPD